jgi:DNA-directed RNA polymerase specialized sigma24 family protein
MTTTCANHDSPVSQPNKLSLDQSADGALEAAGTLYWRHGIYTEARLARKIRREDRRRPSTHIGPQPDQTASFAVERRLDDLVNVARLTAIEEICFRLCYAGRGPRSISSGLGLPCRTVRRRLKSARKKLVRAYSEGPYAGWHEVYLSEVHRYVYRAPRHGA